MNIMCMRDIIIVLYKMLIQINARSNVQDKVASLIQTTATGTEHEVFFYSISAENDLM